LSGGGWIAPLSVKARENIIKVADNLSLDDIDSAFAWFQLEAQVLREQPPPNEVRKDLAETSAQIEKLLHLLEGLQSSPIASLIRMSAFPSGDPEALEKAIGSLHQLRHITPRAIAKLPAGQKRTARAGLVARLIPVLEAAGMTVDSSPTGALCTLVGILIEERGESCADVRSVVRPTVKKWEACSKLTG
jgi:hypothetical protein